jgi:ribosome maturation factor RimP
MFDLDSKIKELVLPYLEKAGLELVEARIWRGGNTYNLTLLIDKPCGGITLDECSCANQEIGAILESADVFSQRYILEVCSPGLDRPFTQERDFKRVLGKEVCVYLKEKVNNKLEFTGLVQDVKEEKVFLKTGEEVATLLIGNIQKAKQVIK